MSLGPLAKAIRIDDIDQALVAMRQALNGRIPSFPTQENLEQFLGDLLVVPQRGPILRELLHHGLRVTPTLFAEICEFHDRPTIEAFLSCGHTWESMVGRWLTGEEFYNTEVWFPFLTAAEEGDLERLKLFASLGGLRLLEVYSNDLPYNPLIGAVNHGQIGVARWLLDVGANIDAHCESLIGDTALNAAVENQDLEAVRLLVHAGANPNILGWMWNSAARRSLELRDQARAQQGDGGEGMAIAREIAELVIGASARFPPPVRPDGKVPAFWPPDPDRDWPEAVSGD